MSVEGSSRWCRSALETDLAAGNTARNEQSATRRKSIGSHCRQGGETCGCESLRHRLSGTPIVARAP